MISMNSYDIQNKNMSNHKKYYKAVDLFGDDGKILSISN